MNMTDDSPVRNRLSNVSSIDDVVKLLKTSSRIMVLTGAGVSNFKSIATIITIIYIIIIIFIRFPFHVEYQISEVITEFMLD